MTLLYQSCKIKHYLLKTMYFFVKTWSHREYQWLVLVLWWNSFLTHLPWSAVLSLRVENSIPQCLFCKSFSQRNTFVQKILIKLCDRSALVVFMWLFFFFPVLHLITTVQFLKCCPQNRYHRQVWKVLGVGRERRWSHGSALGGFESCWQLA